MKKFYYGPLRAGVPTKVLSYNQVRHHPLNSAYPNITSLFWIDAQICPMPLGLCLRIQDIMLVSTPELLFSRSGIGDWDDPPLVMMICQHVSLFGLSNLINPVVKAYFDGEKGEQDL